MLTSSDRADNSMLGLDDVGGCGCGHLDFDNISSDRYRGVLEYSNGTVFFLMAIMAVRMRHHGSEADSQTECDC